MQATPLFLGACALVSIAGVVSGATINTQPIQRGGVGMNEISRPGVDFASDNGLSDQVALPDHYAINTPDGRFDVAELSTRGIYAQRRFAWREAKWTPPPEQVFKDEPQSEWSERGVELDAQDSVSNVAPAGPGAQLTAPDSQDGGSHDGGARLIDVQAELASG
jgi:hypothetical protein